MNWIPGVSDVTKWLTGSGENRNTGSGQGEGSDIPNNIYPPPQDGSDSINIPRDADIRWQTLDPTAFERAATAIKEINKSPSAKDVLNIAKEQEKTKQMQHQNEIEQIKLHMMQKQSKQFEVEHEKKKELMQEEAEKQQRLIEYRDQVERYRLNEQLKQQKELQEENLKAQEASIERQEAMRRGTVEYENELRLKTDLQKIQTEMQMRGKVDRENQDLTLEQIKIREGERRETALKTVQEVTSFFGRGLTGIITDWKKLAALVGSLSILAAGIYTAKNSTLLVRNYIEAILGKPHLVRETSRTTILSPIKAVSKLFSRFTARPQYVMDGIYFQPTLANRLQNIATSTFNTHNNRGTYRNLFLYGPPGTGKTMYAKSLAWNSGMDYAILTGGDVVPLGKDAVTSIHKLFDWARTSRRGVLIFMDEADAFLKNRSKDQMSENLRSALNAFLYRTGEPSKRFMFVIASNQNYQFDSAVLDRLDESIEVGLPGLEERKSMLKHYFTELIFGKAKWSLFARSKVIVPELDYTKKFSEIARKIEGFSGREVAKLVITWQAQAYSAERRNLSEEKMDESVIYMVKQHNQKYKWKDSI